MDSSALVKLVADEPETGALRAYLQSARARMLSSVIAEIEVRRAARRYARPERAEAVLSGLARIGLEPEIITLAASIEPLTLSSLDAIHLATAVSLRAELNTFVAYDRRLVDAASAAGLPVASPA